MEQAH